MPEYPPTLTRPGHMLASNGAPSAMIYAATSSFLPDSDIVDLVIDKRALATRQEATESCARSWHANRTELPLRRPPQDQPKDRSAVRDFHRRRTANLS